jgi:hypothetical protein
MAKQKISIKNIGWRLHPTRKHGVDRDRRFFIRHTIEGKEIVEYVGWASDKWTLEKVIALKNELFENKRKGEGPQTLKAKREMEKEKREKEKARKEEQRLAEITFSAMWKEYAPQAEAGKSEKSWSREDQFYRLWIKPAIGKMPLQKIAPLHLERIKKNMAEAPPAIRGRKREGQKPPKGEPGRSPRTIHYCLAVIRQVFQLCPAPWEVHR